MACCPSTIVSFQNGVTEIPYTALMQQTYGPTPRVYIWYYDVVTGKWMQSSFFTLVSFKDNIITIDHGGPQIGAAVIR
jgi:hypothetical protein